MSTAKPYFDSDGNEMPLLSLIKLEPEWAHSRIKEGEKAIAERDQISAQVERLRDQASELAKHLWQAHIFIESTEAFGGAAKTGILQAGNDRRTQWNIDNSKATLAAHSNDNIRRTTNKSGGGDEH